MAALVREWETSGETRKAFAQRHGLTLSRFEYWKRHVRRDTPAAPRIGFAPVHVTSPSRDGAVIEVVLASGEQLTIRAGAPLDLVRAVVSALRPSC